MDAIVICGLVVTYIAVCAIASGAVLWVLWKIPAVKEKLENFYNNLPMNRK